MDAALQPFALPAALLNTQVKKDKRHKMPSQSENRALYSIQGIRTQKDSHIMNSVSGVKETLKKSFTAARKLTLTFKMYKHFYLNNTKNS